MDEEQIGLDINSASEGLFNDSGFVFVVSFLVFFAVALIFAQLLRRALRKRTEKSEAFTRTLLKVTMAKEAQELAEKEESQQSQKKDFKEAIAIAETLYSNLGGSEFTRDWGYWKRRFTEFWTGMHRHISLEMVVQKGLIHFYVVTPKYLSEYAEQQIQAVYPTAQVEITEDYNIFQPQSAVVGKHLKLTQQTYLPIRTYRHIDSDPLEGITNSLSKIAENEGVAIQILVRPAPAKWRSRAWAISKKMHGGKSFSQAIGVSGGWSFAFFSLPIKALEFVINSFLSKPSKQPQNQNTAAQPEQNKGQKEEEIIKLIEENATKIWFETNVRIICSAANKTRAMIILRNIIGSFAQFKEHRLSNGFKDTLDIFQKKIIEDFIYRNFSELHRVVLSSEELASVYHFPMPSSETPNIAWLASRKAPPPNDLPQEGTILGTAVYKGAQIPVRIKRGDRRRHLYMIGKSGMGKSTLMEKLAKQDIENGEGVCVIDPHGDLVNKILTWIPPDRVDDVIYFDPADVERPIGLNMLEAATPEEMDFVSQEMVSMFYQLVTDPSMIGPMFEHSMRNAMFTLMANKENPGTIADIPRIFTDDDFVKYNLQFVTDPMVRAYWEKEMAKQSEQQKGEMLGYLISKVGRFVENGLMRNIIGQQKSGFDFADVMNNQKILLVNLSKGKIGDINSQLLGLIIVSKLTMAALRRAGMAEEERRDFYLYIDEFQNYITDSISTILSEARKYRLSLIIAHQYIGQLVKNGDPKIKEAVLGNAGTICSFKIGIEDAEIIAKEFAPTVNAYDLINTENFHMYMKLLVDNRSTRAFTVKTIYEPAGDPMLAEKLKQLSRLKFGRERKQIEAEVLERTKLGQQ